MSKVKPFVILALPRTGTKMLVSALASHPYLPTVTHEFRGDREEFEGHPYVLSNRWRDFFEDVTKIHVYREDAIAGARSMLLMSYNFPDKVVTLPAHEVTALAERRKAWDREFAARADHSISYEELCGGGAVTSIYGADKLCDWLGVPRCELVTRVVPNKKLVLRNQDEIECLRA